MEKCFYVPRGCFRNQSKRGMDKHSFAPCLPTSFWVFSRKTWTQTRCALSVFFRDAKFLLEAVGITKRKKENQRVVFFLSCRNEIILACQICKNFNGKLGFSSFFFIICVCAQVMNSVPINGATLSGWRVLPKPKQKRNGRTNILLLLAYQRFWVFFSKDTDTNKAVRQ